MARRKTQESDKKDLSSFKYESVGNIKYDLDPNSIKWFNLKAQFPMRLNRGDTRTISTGIKVRVPENTVGAIMSFPDLVSKNEIVVLGSPQLFPPDEELKEIYVTVKNFGNLPKVINMGETIASFVILQAGIIENQTQENKDEEIL